jgi:hypothetical protein
MLEIIRYLLIACCRRNSLFDLWVFSKGRLARFKTLFTPIPIQDHQQNLLPQLSRSVSFEAMILPCALSMLKVGEIAHLPSYKS